MKFYLQHITLNIKTETFMLDYRKNEQQNAARRCDMQ